MKKLVLSLGSIATTVSPIAAVISCGISGGTIDPAEFAKDVEEAIQEINSSNISQNEKDTALERLRKIGNLAGFEEKINEIISGIKNKTLTKETTEQNPVQEKTKPDSIKTPKPISVNWTIITNNIIYVKTWANFSYTLDKNITQNQNLFDTGGTLFNSFEQTGASTWGGKKEELIKGILLAIYKELEDEENFNVALNNVASILDAINNNNTFSWGIDEAKANSLLNVLSGVNLTKKDEILAKLNNSTIAGLTENHFNFNLSDSNEFELVFNFDNVRYEKVSPHHGMWNYQSQNYGSHPLGSAFWKVFGSSSSTEKGDFVKTILESIYDVIYVQDFSAISLDNVAKILKAIKDNISVSWNLDDTKVSEFLVVLETIDLRNLNAIVTKLNQAKIQDASGKYFNFSLSRTDVVVTI